MHTARQLDTSLFAVGRNGSSATRERILPGWTALDRLGIVMTEPFGAVGASHLIQLAITAFYDVRPSRREGRLDGVDQRPYTRRSSSSMWAPPHGDHSVYDFWPARKEVVVEADPRLVLDAINDRAITRIAVPDSSRVEVAHEHKEPAAARDRIATAIAYSPTGRVREPEWEIAGLDRRTEMNPALALDGDRSYVSAAALSQPPADALLQERSWPVRTEARRDEGRHGLAIAQQRRARSATTGGWSPRHIEASASTQHSRCWSSPIKVCR